MHTHFGKYFSRNSLVHKFDPRLKFVTFILFLVTIFLPAGFIPYFFLTGLFLFFFLIADLPFKLLITVFKTIFLLIFFLFFFNLINIESPESLKVSGSNDAHKHGHEAGKIIFEKWIFKLTDKGLASTAYYALKIFLVILLTLILVTTTSAKALTFAIEKLLSPLKIIGLPIHIFSMIISLTLRLVPTLIQEANTIIESQSSRGLDFYNSNLKNKFKALIALIIPLIASIFKRADEMAIAMESRGYDPYKKRTSFQSYYFIKKNLIIFGIILIIVINLFIYASNPELFSDFIRLFNNSFTEDHWYLDELIFEGHNH